MDTCISAANLELLDALSLAILVLLLLSNYVACCYRGAIHLLDIAN